MGRDYFFFKRLNSYKKINSEARISRLPKNLFGGHAKYETISKSYPKIFEISPHSSPLPSGERAGVRGQNVRREFSDLRYKNLRLFRDFAGKRGPLRGSRSENVEWSASACCFFQHPPLAKGDFQSSNPPSPPFSKGGKKRLWKNVWCPISTIYCRWWFTKRLNSNVRNLFLIFVIQYVDL